MLSNTIKLATAGGGKQSYWIATLGGTGNDYGHGIAVDSSGNVYVGGYTESQGAGSYDCLIAKYNSSGVIQWQRSLGGANFDESYALALDSSGNVYVTGYTDSQGAGGPDCLIAKYNSSGVIQWQRSLGGTGADVAYGIAVDSSGNVYVTGYTDSQGVGLYDCLVAKYNSSGVIQWQRSLGGASNDSGYGIAVDSSGNVYVCGYTSSSGGAGGSDCLIAKYDSSGVIQWQRSLGGTGADVVYAIAVDSSGNVYVCGYTNSPGGAGGSDCLIAKYDSSGVIQWQRSLGGTGSDAGRAIVVDSSGNVYVTGNANSSGGAGSYDCLIAKYNSSGVIQWQRSLGGTGSDYGNCIAVDSSGNVYVCGYTNSPGGAGLHDCLIAKLPADGSLTGTYGSLSYASRTLTDASRTLTDASRALTDASRTLTDASRTLTDASRTLTSTTTTL